MKLLITALFVISSVVSYAQTSINAKAGGLHSYAKGVKALNSVGYYAGLTYNDQREDLVGFTLDVLYTNQMHRVDDITSNIHGFNVAVGPDFHFSKSFPLYLSTGLFVNREMLYRVDGETVRGAKKVIGIGFYGGLNYKINRLEIQSRFTKGLSYQNFIQLGVSYSIFTN